jgi:hypothetical protein
MKFVPTLAALLLGLVSLGTNASAAPILVYNFKLTGNKTTYFYNPNLALESMPSKSTATQLLLRDIATKRSVEIDTNTANGSKNYRINFPGSDWSTIPTTTYADRVKIFEYPANTLIKTPGVQLERIVRYTADKSNFLSFIAGPQSALKLSNSPNIILAPKSMTGVSHFWGTDFVSDTSWGYPGQRFQLNPETVTFTFNQTYSNAANIADSTDTATPTNVTPGTLPYAAYRITRLLNRAGYTRN